MKLRAYLKKDNKKIDYQNMIADFLSVKKDKNINELKGKILAYVKTRKFIIP